MKIRLEVLKELLTDDGAIFVHIDDDEMPYLKVLMDEIFNDNTNSITGDSGNHVATIVWQKKHHLRTMQNSFQIHTTSSSYMQKIKAS